MQFKVFLDRYRLACKIRNYSHYLLEPRLLISVVYFYQRVLCLFVFSFRCVSIQNIQLLTTSVFIVEIITATVAARIMKRIIVNLGKALTQTVPVYHPQRQNRHNFKHLKVLANKM